MYCPKCQNEYREGITICPECNVELVAELEEDEELVPVASVAEESLKEKISKYLTHENIKNEWSEETDDEGNPVHVVSVPYSNAKETKKMISAIVKVETEKKMKDILENMPEEELIKEQEKEKEELQKLANTKTFTKASERSSDYSSSGSLFIGFGALLLIFAGVNKAGIMTLFSATFSLVVIAGMGLLFFVYGIYSIRKGKSLEGEAATETENENKIKEYMKENITKEELDALNDDDTTPELLYLKQSDYVKEKILKAFPETNEDYADILTDEFMNEMYNE